MKSLNNIFKISFCLLSIFVVILGLTLSYLKKNSIYIDNSKLQKLVNRYVPEYLLESDGGNISYIDGKFFLNITKGIVYIHMCRVKHSDLAWNQLTNRMLGVRR